MSNPRCFGRIWCEQRMAYHLAELYRAILRKDDKVVPSSFAIAAEHLTPFKPHSNQIADICCVPPRYPATGFTG